jgi:hypothetical protein
MREIVVSTEMYSEKLNKFFDVNNYPVITRSINGDSSYVIVEYEFLLVNDLTLLMRDIVLDENSIIRSSPKIKEVINNAVFEKKRNTTNRDVYYLIKNENKINLDGYINFKFGQLINDMNNILYYLIKRNLKKLLTIDDLMI